ncbi:MAG: PilZ domain-containing protein [Pseudomonadota bacterium]
MQDLMDEIVRLASVANAMRADALDEKTGVASLKVIRIVATSEALKCFKPAAREAHRSLDVLILRLKFALETTRTFVDERSRADETPQQRPAINATALSFAWRRVTEELQRFLPSPEQISISTDGKVAAIAHALEDASRGNCPHADVRRRVAVRLDRRVARRIPQSDPVSVRWEGDYANATLADASETGVRIAQSDRNLPPAGTIVSLTLPTGEVMTGDLVWAQQDSGGLQLFTRLDAVHPLLQAS